MCSANERAVFCALDLNKFFDAEDAAAKRRNEYSLPAFDRRNQARASIAPGFLILYHAALLEEYRGDPKGSSKSELKENMQFFQITVSRTCFSSVAL